MQLSYQEAKLRTKQSVISTWERMTEKEKKRRKEGDEKLTREVVEYYKYLKEPYAKVK